MFGDRFAVEGEGTGLFGAVVPDRGFVLDPEAAVPRPPVFRPRARSPVAARVADGVPTRGDSRGRRLRGVQGLRPVGDGGAAWTGPQGHQGVPQRVPASGDSTGERIG